LSMADSADSDVGSLSLKELKALITEGGLSFADCIDKDDLRARAREAQEKFKAVDRKVAKAKERAVAVAAERLAAQEDDSSVGRAQQMSEMRAAVDDGERVQAPARRSRAVKQDVLLGTLVEIKDGVHTGKVGPIIDKRISEPYSSKELQLPPWRRRDRSFKLIVELDGKKTQWMEASRCQLPATEEEKQAAHEKAAAAAKRKAEVAARKAEASAKKAKAFEKHAKAFEPDVTELAAEQPVDEESKVSSSCTPVMGRKALVIGVSAYPGINALKNPVNDASDIAGVLESMGYEVSPLFNGTCNQMHKTIDAFTSSLDQGDIALLYFAGHGCEYRNSNYLIATDTFSDGDSDVWIARKGVKVLDALDAILERKPRLAAMFLDCCREFRGMKRSMGSSSRAGSGNRGLCTFDVQQDYDNQDAYIGLACAPGNLAADNPEERNGLFTKHLKEHIKSNEDIDMMFRKVSQAVMKESRNSQRPWRESSVISPEAKLV